MKGNVTNITETEWDFILEVSIERPILPDEVSNKINLADKGRERKEYLNSDEFKQALKKVNEERTSIRNSLKLGEIELTF